MLFPPISQITPASTPVRITSAEIEIHDRILTTIEPLDRVLGGGIVVGSIVLIGGEPGQGKSTLLVQALAATGRRILYVSGEESIGQVAARARRCNAATDQIWIVAETDIDVIIAHARDIKPDVLALDSIQTCIDSEATGAPGSPTQVKACTAKIVQYAKPENVATILIGHVTKDGAFAGPKTLEHLVDATLFLDASEIFASNRVLRAHKNRYGSTQEIGGFIMHAAGLAPMENDPDRTPTPVETIHDEAGTPDEGIAS